MKILIVDTEPRWIAHWRKLGADSASTLTGMLEAMDDRDYDVILISARGIEWLKGINYPPTIVVATTSPSVREAVAAYTAGAAAYITKDFSLTPCGILSVGASSVDAREVK